MCAGGQRGQRRSQNAQIYAKSSLHPIHFIGAGRIDCWAVHCVRGVRSGSCHARGWVFTFILNGCAHIELDAANRKPAAGLAILKTSRVILAGASRTGAPSLAQPRVGVGISGCKLEHTFLEHTADTPTLRKQAKDGAPGIRYMGRQHECSLLELKTKCNFGRGLNCECMCPELNNFTIRNRIHPPCFNRVLVPPCHDLLMSCSSEVHAVLIGNS